MGASSHRVYSDGGAIHRNTPDEMNGSNCIGDWMRWRRHNDIHWLCGWIWIDTMLTDVFGNVVSGIESCTSSWSPMSCTRSACCTAPIRKKPWPSFTGCRNSIDWFSPISSASFRCVLTRPPSPCAPYEMDCWILICLIEFIWIHLNSFIHFWNRSSLRAKCLRWRRWTPVIWPWSWRPTVSAAPRPIPTSSSTTLARRWPSSVRWSSTWTRLSWKASSNLHRGVGGVVVSVAGIV